MPKLYTVVINHVMIYYINIYLPWVQLKSLIINCIEESVFHFLIIQCTALETGSFTSSDRLAGEQFTIDIILECLKTPHIHFSNLSDPSIFDGIHFQVLNDFTLFLAYTAHHFDWTVAPEHIPPTGTVPWRTYHHSRYGQYGPSNRECDNF